MEINIEIKRDAVFTQVSRRTEWQGTRSPETPDYSRLTLKDSDKALYQSFFDEAAMHAIDICRPFLRRASNTDESLELAVMVAEGSDSGSLEATVENMLTAHVLALWQEIVAPSRAEGSFRRRDDYALKLESILYHHPVPVRTIHNS